MKLRMKTSLAAAVFTMSMAAPAFAAPLFPDVPENHWARDAVATLAAKGIVEGYPDGTFKGDRASTRWEVAMIVARLLAKMEQEHATFATKAELAELQKLVDALRSELDALGVRVNKLEDQVSKLDMRVSELERITFYGSFEARLTAQSFGNSSDSQNTNYDNSTGATTLINPVNYNQAVGTMQGAVLNPKYGEPMPVMDMRNGVALTNGTGLSMKAILGMRIRVTDDIDAGAEFAAYSAAGNAAVDAFWGVTAPNAASQFTGNGGFFGLGNANTGNGTYTRMVLDNFWVMHNPSGTKLTIGAYNEDSMDDILFAGQKNYGAYGNEYLDNFGFDLNGSYSFEDTGVLRWEVMGSKWGAYNTGLDNKIATTDYENCYNTDIIGANVGFEFGAGHAKVNFLHAANYDANGNATIKDGYMGISNNLQWVNPNTYANADYAAADLHNDQVLYYGNAIGAQEQFGWGLSVDYKWDIGDSGDEIYAAGEYAHTDYFANKNSKWCKGGNAWRIEVGSNLLEGDLDLSLSYTMTDPTYDPFVNYNPYVANYQVANWSLPGFNNYEDMWSFHDVDTYTNNRKGIKFNGQWRFLERRGLLWAKFAYMDQTKTSKYDTLNSDGEIGFAPGFRDNVFYGYNVATYEAGTLNSLEDKRGSQTRWGIGASYKWDNPRLKLDLGYEQNSYRRGSGMAGILGNTLGVMAESQNRVKLDNTSAHLGLGWEVNDKWNLRVGCDYMTAKGHWDPFGAYNTYAGTAGDTGFNTIDSQQFVPFIGFDYDMSANTQWNMDFRYYDTVDKVNGSVFSGVQTVGNTGAGYSAHPMSWNGWQVSTQFKVKF